MTNNIPQKKNSSCLHVIKTLKTLLQDDYTMAELVNTMNESENDSIYNHSTISKYINTCRFCGIQIPKINNRYYLITIPFGFELNDTEAKLVEDFQASAAKVLNNTQYNFMQSFFNKILKFAGKKLVRIEKNSFNLSFEIFERSISNETKVRLLLKNNEMLDVTPLKIINSDTKTYFNVLYKNKERIIDINRISGIQMTNEKFFPQFKPQLVIYKLKNGLAKRYQAREHEEVSIIDENTILIKNKGEGKDALIARLMRYDSDCEILEPDFLREEIKLQIKNALSNYGEI